MGTTTSTHLKENDDDNDDNGEEADHSELDTLLQQWQYDEDGTVRVNYNEDTHYGMEEFQRVTARKKKRKHHYHQ